MMYISLLLMDKPVVSLTKMITKFVWQWAYEIFTRNWKETNKYIFL